MSNSRSRVAASAALLLLLPCIGLAEESFYSRLAKLSRSNASFAAARKILEKDTPNTRDELGQAIALLDNALKEEKSGPDRSVIETTVAKIYLAGLQDCDHGKRYSAAAVASDLGSPDALEIDVGSDMCVAGTTKDYTPVIQRLETLAKQGRYFWSLYSLLGTAYEIRGNQTNTRADLLRARDAYLKAKERGEPEASPNALSVAIEMLDESLKQHESGPSHN